ncbi:TPA: hypothetical protein RUZ39_001667 [Vibrio cholerae]|nr:hypothetical protein [Vibrio cholerae]
MYELSNLNEIQLIEHIITTRIRKEKSSFDRLTKNLIVPSVSYDKSKGTGSLNNEHWVFCVTYAFRDALDLAFQRRIEHKKTVHIWTQGPMISFKEGDLLHHKSGSIALQVKHAAAMAWDSDKNKMYYGYVNYQIFDFEKKTYMKEDKTCTQLEFLDVLINGLSIDIPNHSGV